jgi:predicted anti-sigma-YlaC factor YlaD
VSLAPQELTCRELVERVTAYLDGVLAPAEHARLEQHLVLCLGCRHHLTQVRGTLRVLHELPLEGLRPEAVGGLIDMYRTWATTEGAS